MYENIENYSTHIGTSTDRCNFSDLVKGKIFLKFHGYNYLSSEEHNIFYSNLPYLMSFLSSLLPMP